MSDVADHKDTRHVRLQEPWITVHLPSSRSLPIAHQVGAGENEPALISFDDIRKPLCVWGRSDHDEQRIGWYFVVLVACSALDGYCFQMIFTVRLYNGRVEFDLDVRSLF